MHNGSVLSYLVTITRNECFDAIRRGETLHARQQRYAQHKEHFVFSNLVETKELGQQLQSAISSISHPACRHIFELSYLEGKKNAEIAAELNISTGTVKNQVSRALKYLREKLAPNL